MKIVKVVTVQRMGLFACCFLSLLLASCQREQSTVMCMTVDCSSEEMLEVNQEEPKEEPVYDIVLPNSTSYVHSIASGVGAVIRHLWQCSRAKVV